jgi:hypothetical protein
MPLSMSAFDFLGRGHGDYKGLEAIFATSFGSRARCERIRSAVEGGTYRPEAMLVAEALLSGPRADFFRVQMGEIALAS